MNHLAVVPESGEIPMECAGCSELQIQLDGSEREVRRLRRLLAEARRDNDAKAREHALWDDANIVFDYWQQKTGHLKTRFDWQRFELVRPFLESDGGRECCIAVLGAVFDCFTTTRKNGTVKRFDDWELLFRDRGKFDEFRARAPQGIKR